MARGVGIRELEPAKCGPRGGDPDEAALPHPGGLEAYPEGCPRSPPRGYFPLHTTAIAFQPSATAAQSEQQIGDAANFTRTFTWPASSHDNVRGSELPQAEQSRLSAHAGIILGNSEAG